MKGAARFGRFELVARIGAGGAGEVLLVADGERHLALKRLLPHFDGGDAAATFEREGALAARLVHPNVVRVFEHGHVGGVPYVLMELVDGKSLHALVRTVGRLPAGAAAFVVREACRALAYLHGVSGDDGRPLALVHRDVSPANLLVSRRGEVKLCDFGIAKATAATGTHTVPGFVKGKKGYRSPEQEAHAPVDARSDVYAAGVVLFEALVGRRPRDDAERPSTSVHGVPAALDEICLRARARDRAARFAGAREMAAALDGIVEELGGEALLRAGMTRWCPAPLSAEPTRTRTLARLDRRARTLVVASALAVALGGGWLAWRRWSASPSRVAPPATASTPPSSIETPGPRPPPPPTPTTAAASAPRSAPSRPSRAKRTRHPPAPPRSPDYMPDPFQR
ncbi:MAG TPA: serine/threonine-protein kinase [Polyangia bacterium]